MRTYAERMVALAAQIQPKRTRMEAIQRTADEDGERELTAQEGAEFDGLSAEVRLLESSLRRLKSLSADELTAEVIEAGDRPRVPAQVRATVPDEQRGLAFARLVSCFAVAKGSISDAMQVAKNRYPRQPQIQTTLRALVPGATTTDPTWAEPLIEPTNLVSEFVEYLRPRTIIGQFGVNGIPSLRRVPFNITVPAQTTGGEGYWVGEGYAKPLTKFDYTRIILRWTKVANIAVLSEDVLRFSSPSAEVLVRNALAEALIARLDSDFVNPSITVNGDIRPASITNGATTSAASGIDAAAVRADIKTAVTFFITNNIPTNGLVILMRDSQALSLSLMRNALGQREFPDMTVNGGRLEGLPVVTSMFMPQGVVAFVSADNIYLADDGGISIDMSREASLEMDSDPTNKINNGASPEIPVEQSMVSMFQTNSVAIRAERTITWKRRRTASVYYFTSTGWGNPDTSPATAPI